MANGTRGLRVLQPGVLSLIQDLGRFGYQHLGCTTGGAADEHAFLWANRLLNNTANSPTLELCVGGLQLKAQVATRFAITGADMGATLNGIALTPWQSYSLQPEDELQFGYARSGMCAYLAIQNGLQIAPTLGSVATVLREKIGGLDGSGRPLREGDVLPCTSAPLNLCRSVAARFIPNYHQPLKLRVIEAQQNTLFEQNERRRFFSCEYEITRQSDRMGARLHGEPIQANASGIISEGTSFGSIQVPPDGQPIILLKDRQTIGGYPKFGTLLPLDAFALCQRRPGTQVRFEPITLSHAQRLMRRFYQFFEL